MEWLKKHIRVTISLMIREMSTRYGGKPGGYLWAFIDPIAHVGFMTFIFHAIARVPALGSSFALFFASGYLPYMFYSSMAGFINGSIKANRSLLSYPIVAPADVVVSRYFVQILTSSFVGFLVLFLVAAEDNLSVFRAIQLDRVVTASLMATLLGLGVGTANIALFARSSLYEKVFGVIMRPLVLVSGVFFIPDSLPHPFRDVVLYNPLAHVIMWFRSGIYPEYRAAALDIHYLVECTASALFIGALLFTMSAQELREG
ncbi:RkpT2, cell surface polysaccharide export ABC-2 transporter (plasmid) [Sinorhizobium fredii NGR234]|uniref:Transport permease protein n=1 Tax=Sinorhizobium fredii (strain NBRC 101917 / NGR234) TaxID=394 RepID=Q071E8_SINFN|nr:ABC transporter permease [Sinorhizobium fredii]ABD15244.1 putative cell surface polysaccharide export ABC-2 transporter permease protein [Sinorhizobium fredii NGR234]ACP22400.1 RkpT2, cell surface polysaccharide export ABC-2 transporter [Sinorhizobium fredii NGR234]